MNKMLKILLIILLIIPFAFTVCYAREDILTLAGNAADTESLISAAPENAKKLIQGGDITGVDLNESIKKLLADGADSIKGKFRNAVGQIVFIVCAATLCGIAASFMDKSEQGSLNPVALCGAAAIIAGGMGSFGTTINLCRDGIIQLDEFSTVLFPSVAAACTLMGKPASGGAAAGALIITGVVIKLITSILFPIIYVYAAVSAVNAVTENELSARIAAFIKWGITNLMKLCMIAYTAYSGIAAAIGGTADAGVSKTAKFVMSSAIPVVGSIISDAAGAVVAGAGIVKNSIGVFGLVSVIAICIQPFIASGLNYIAYKGAAAVCSVTGEKSLVRLIDGLGDGFGMALGMLGTVAVLFFVSVVLSITMVSAV